MTEDLLKKVWDCLRVGLWLGLWAFGGPVAHLSYFRRAYVEKRQWLSPENLAGLIAFAQALPGPTSSQVNALIGLKRAGYAGALAAVIGFSLPSVLIMIVYVMAAPHLAGGIWSALLGGLRLMAVIMVAQALWVMAPKLCPNWSLRGLGLLVAGIALWRPEAWVAPALILITGLIGSLLIRPGAPVQATQPARLSLTLDAVVCLTVFCLLFLIGFLPGHMAVLFAVLYRDGALVFGGGHVVLPLLQQDMVGTGWVSQSRFLEIYGVAQILPGPLFSIGAGLGIAALSGGSAPLVDQVLWGLGGGAALILPGILLCLGLYPLWNRLSGSAHLSGSLIAVNAAVTGLLAAAFINPILLTGVRTPRAAIESVIGFGLVQGLKVQPLLVAMLMTGAELGIYLYGPQLGISPENQ